GTLTEGRPQLTDVVTTSDQEGSEFLRLVASAEQGSEHPLATAIVRGATERGLALSPAEAFTALAGRGMAARVEGHEVLVGNAALLAERGIATDGLEDHAAELAAAGKTPMFVAVDGQGSGLVAVADTIKPSARRLIP